MSRKTSNQTAQNQNPTSSGTHFDTAHFIGGGHAFGNNNVVNNANFTFSGSARLYEIHGHAVINHLPDTNALKKIQSIVNLPRVQAGRKDYETKKKSGLCFPGTRKALLQEMMDWVTGEGESRMYALSGLAGIGKSTIIYTVATQADELSCLGASFFFSRDEADRKNAKKFFTTIAYQLCLFNEEFAKAIAESLVTERGSTAITGSPQEQLQILILDPLQAIVMPDTPQILIVVDALDECDDKDAPSVLNGLRQLVRALPSFKVILTTRPQQLLDGFTIHGGHKIFYLQDIEDKIVNDDIRLYIKHSLSLEQVRAQLRLQWCASEAQVESLVQAAGKLFIIASTAVRYILDEHWCNPAKRIKTFLDAFAQGHSPFKNLSDFYTVILRSAVPDDCDDEELVERYKATIGTIVFSQVPLSIDKLADLIGIEAEEISIVLRQLRSVILVGTDNIPVIYHKSFPDYVTDPARCKDVNLLINPMIRHTWIAMRCFKIMDKYLKYNILGLGTPARFMTNENGFAKDGITDERLEDIVPQQLRYACVYWANHYEVANIEDVDLMKELEIFVGSHMLHWFELLSLIRKLVSAHQAIRIILKRLQQTSSDLLPLLLDGLRFISKFYKIIERSALHTYYSALAFTPTDSILRHRYTQEKYYNACDVDGVPERWERWDTLIAHLNHGEKVDDVQFSLDSTMLASWNKEKDQSKGVLKLWDAATGTPISMIKGDGFAITNDLSTVASFKANAISLYNVNGNEQGITFTTQVEVLKVAISSEISRIAAILSDGTLCLWDSRNGELVETFGDDKNDPIRQDCLQFSATGARLAYSSLKGVKLRSGTDGRLIANLDCTSFSHYDPDKHPAYIQFSRDGSRIASWVYGSQLRLQLRLWNCVDGNLAFSSTPGRIMAISTNGSLLASAGFRIVWCEGIGDILDLGPRSTPLSIASSHNDDTLAITTSSDIKLYNVNSRTIATLPFTGAHRAPVFSPDCSHLAAASTDGTVSLWDIRDIEASSPTPDNGEIIEVTVMAFSRDCSRVVCGFRGGAIDLWETGVLIKRRIVDHTDFSIYIEALRFSPDDMRFASMSSHGSIALWECGDGTLLGTGGFPGRFGEFCAMEVSNRMVVAAGDSGIILWDPITLDHLTPDQRTLDHSWDSERRYSRTILSFSPNGAFLAAIRDIAHNDIGSCEIIVFDVTERTTIATFGVPSQDIRAMAFQSDNSWLAVQLSNDLVLTYSLIHKKMIQGTTFESFRQLCNLPLWHGIPVHMTKDGGQYYLAASFPQHDQPVPVLWIPQELHVRKWTQASSMIALGCADGHIVLLRLHIT